MGMTEQEAMEWLESIVFEQAPKTQKAILLGIRALEEVQQLRKEMWELNQICRDYTSLGTVEELKEAKEKQIAKKPNQGEITDKMWDGHWECPICEQTVGVMDIFDNYCCKCGQKIDWGNEDD